VAERPRRSCRFPSRAGHIAGERIRCLADFHRAAFTIACEAAQLGCFAPLTRHIFVAAINVVTRVAKRPMNPAAEMAAKITTDRPAARALAGSIDQLDEQLRVSVEALLHPDPPRPPVEELDDLLSAINHHLDDEAAERKTIYNRLRAIETGIERPASRGVAGYLLAVCIGVVAAFIWQSYSEPAKRLIAMKTPELGWSPENKQIISGWFERLGWMPARTVASTPKALAAPSPDPQQLQQIEARIAALQQVVERQIGEVRVTAQQLAAGQDQIVREITELQAADEAILTKIPAPPPRPAPARKPAPPPSPRHP
jgi:hypothetical protein